MLNLILEAVIEIAIPDEEDIDFAAYFQGHLESDFAYAIDHGVSEFDERAQIDDTQITDVVITGESIEVMYEIEFSAHYGCRDKNYSGTSQRSIHGRRVAGVWVFARHIPPPPRSTHEEF